MAVAVDATGTALIAGTGSGATSASYTGITVGAGANALIYVIAIGVTAGAPSSGATATWDSGGTNQAMFKIGEVQLAGVSGVFYVVAFGLRAPTAGNKTLAVSWTTTSTHSSNAISLTGVDQSSDANAFKGFQSLTRTNSISTTAVTVTSAVGDMVIGAYAAGATTSFSPGTTWESDVTTLNGPDTIFVRNAGAASVTMTGTPTNACDQVTIGFDVAAATAVALPFSLTDWPRVSPIRVSKPDGSRALNPNQFTNPIPINNTPPLFIPVQPVRLAKVDQFHTDISKFTNPIPLNVQELNRPWRIRGYPTPPQPYNPNLFIQVIVAAPFSQLQWVAARPLYSQVATPVNPPYNPLIYSEVPFVNSVFARVSPVVSAPFIGQVYNVNLYSQTVSPAPFVTIDYSKAYPIRGVPQQVQGYNVNLYQTVSASVTARLGFHPIEAGSVKQTNIASGLQNLEDGTAG
jgi:hypothetical protein